MPFAFCIRGLLTLSSRDPVHRLKNKQFTFFFSVGFEFKPVNERLDIEQKFVFQGFLNQITRHISHFEGPQDRVGVLGYWRAKKDFNALGSL